MMQRIKRIEAWLIPMPETLLAFPTEATYHAWLAEPERETEPQTGLRSVYIGIDLDRV